jgi:GGDEF domain-containing protein
MNFVDFVQSGIFQHCESNKEGCSQLKLKNIENMKNWFAHGYLHQSVKNTDMMSVPLFSVLSTTRIATSIIAWINEINEIIVSEDGIGEHVKSSYTCELMSFLNKPFFNMIFVDDNNLYEFNKMHFELHNLASSLLFFMEQKNYTQAYFVYNEFVDQCRNFLNYYFERVVLFEQNKQNYFYQFAKEKIENGKQLTLFTFNIRNMQMINKIWGLDTGDHIVNEVERLVDRQHGMNSESSVFIKTKNAEFIVMVIDKPDKETLEMFHQLISTIEAFLTSKDSSLSDVHISSAYLPLGEHSVDHSNNLKAIVTEAIVMSKTKDSEPLTCNIEILRKIKKRVLHNEKIRHFIVKSFDSNNFKPYYHTIFDTKTGEISHAEALARVCDEDSCISAFSFIDYMIESGRIVELDKVMLARIISDFPTLKKM